MVISDKILVVITLSFRETGIKSFFFLMLQNCASEVKYMYG